MTESLWFKTLNPESQAHLRLFCLPYAGGSARVFCEWQRQLPSMIEVCPVELPGHGSRLREAPLTQIQSITRELHHSIRPHLDRPFAFFGHSMGALICFDLARRLRDEPGVEPAHLFVSGCRAPQIGGVGDPVHQLTDVGLMDKLRQLNGIPREVLNHPVMMQLMLPLLRADFEAGETYRYSDALPFGCPITVFGGLFDPEVGRDDLEAWRQQTTGSFRVRMFDGDHFFIHRLEPLLLPEIAFELRALMGDEV